MGYGLEPGQVSEDAEVLRNMTHLGEAMAWLEAALKASPRPYPVRAACEA